MTHTPTVAIMWPVMLAPERGQLPDTARIACSSGERGWHGLFLCSLMKHILPAFCLLLTIRPVRADSYSTVPVTSADVATVIGLNPADFDIRKTVVTFDKPKAITFRYTTYNNSTPCTRDCKIPGTSSSVTVLTYVPKDGGPVKSLHFWVSGSGGGIYSSFPFDATKAKMRETLMLDGVFTIRASPEKGAAKAEYTIQLLTADGG